jgi:hypothetical protein
MRPQVMGGIQDRAGAFVKKCIESGQSGIDAYVKPPLLRFLIKLSLGGVSALLRIRLCFSSPFWSIWYTFDRKESGLGNDGRAFVSRQP